MSTKTTTNPTTLIPTATLAPSTYNPRTTDPARLDLIELSLRHLGFLIPIYATPDGEIISGHQRHLVAQRMGLARVPVIWTRPIALPQRKALNILFNRGTNDMRSNDTPQRLTETLAQIDLDALAAAVPEKDPTSEAFYPCLRMAPRPIQPLIEANSGRWIQYAANAARLFHQQQITLPVIVTPDLRVVNGIGRLQDLAEKRAETAPVIAISAAEGALAEALLNLLSMHFDLHTRYADVLRYNSFRRARTVRDWLGYGFTFAVHPKKQAKTFDIGRADHRARWIKEHGTSVVDFGAGHLTETFILRKVGIRVAAFEPYRLTRNEIDKPKSLALVREFLAAVAAGTPFTSVFLCSVLNSVPFVADRQKVARICHALCGPQTRLYASAKSHTSDLWTNKESGKPGTHVRGMTYSGFVLDYEPRVSLGELNDKPKMQKFHTPQEFQALFDPLFASVQVGEINSLLTALCARPRPLDHAALREALWFEFETLPYPDGTTMGLGRDALAAFSARLGVTLDAD